MKALKVAAEELEKIIKSRFIRVAVIVVAFMPLLYSFLYLYAFWDPYSKLDKLPVAVVNEDKGGMSEGKETNFGDEIVKKLKENKEFKWEFTDYKNALEGLKGKKYYFAIVIPEDFTKNLLSVESMHPQKASIVYITNDKKNFLATQIGNKAIESLQTEIANCIRKGYIDTIFKDLAEIGSGLKEASEAENKLSAGSLELSSGAEKLSNNMDKAAKGALQLKEGIYNLKEGLPQLMNGSEALYNGINILSEKFSSSGDVKALSEGVKLLTDGISKLSQGLSEASQSALKLKEGVSGLTRGYDQVGQNISAFTQSVSQLGSGLGQMTESLALAQKTLQEYITKHPEEVNDPNLQRAIFIISETSSGINAIESNLNKSLYQVQQLNDALSKLQQASNSINNGMDSLTAGLSYMTNASSQLVKGSDNLSSGLSQFTEGIKIAGEKLKDISDGLYRLNAGIKNANDGVSKLYDGAVSLSNGILALKDGTLKLSEGARTLHDNQALLAQKLSDASLKLQPSEFSSDKRAMLNEPIALKTRKLYPVKNYGVAFAPYFIPLSLWVGSLILFFLIDIFDKSKYEGVSNVSIQLGKFISLAVVGILQSVVSSFVLVEGLKLDVHNLLYYYFINAVMSIAFIAIIQLLVMLFGIAGKFFAVVLLMLQLTSSGGTFPMELLPKFFNVINPYLPMTYGVAGLREAISGDNISLILHNISIIAGFGALFLLFTILLAERVDKIEIVQKLRQM